MNKVVKLSITFMFFITSCTTLRQHANIPQKVVQEIKSNVSKLDQTENLDFSVLRGYFLKSNMKFKREVNFFSIESMLKFRSMMGTSNIKENYTAVPNFNEEIVIIIAMQPSRNSKVISIKHIRMLDNSMYVDYEIEVGELKDLGYFHSNVQILKVQKPKVITNICFIDNNKKALVLPFGNRNINSPINTTDMLRNYTGVYLGTVTVSSTENVIAVELNLKPDYTFCLKQTYLTSSGKIFIASGTWSTALDLSSIVLNKNTSSSFYFKDKNTIEKLKNPGEKINTNMYILKK